MKTQEKKKQEKKKLTLADLIKDKEKLLNKKKKTQDLFLDKLGLTVTIEEPDKDLVRDTVELAEDESFTGSSDEFMVYNIMVEPNLKDAELQKEFGCEEPTDIVSKIFDIGTISGIANSAMALAGYFSKVTAVEDLKN